MGTFLKYAVTGAAAVWVAEWAARQPFVTSKGPQVQMIAKYGSGAAAVAIAHKFLGKVAL